MPTWIGPTIAVSLLIIALAFVAIAIATFAFGRKVADQTTALTREVSELRRELHPTIEGVGKLARSGDELASLVRDEVVAVVATSRRLRRGVRRGYRRVRDRLTDLDTLYGVLHEEVEDTALSVAATLRNVRYGSGALRRIRRLLRSRR